jgi:ADP-dependent phosphofructokinase/glucokinase
LRREWEKRYEGTITPNLAGKRILFAYNSCVDKILHVRDTSWIVPRQPMPSRLDSMSDVSAALHFCMTNGVGHELIFQDMALRRHLEGFRFDEVRLGGQASIMAFMADICGAIPILYPGNVSGEMSELLPESTLVPQDGSLVSARGMRTHESMPHYVFEFERGLKVGGTRVMRDNRFIASIVPPDLEFDEGFVDMLPVLAREAQCSVISGFHLIAPRYRNATYRDHVEGIASHMRILKGDTKNKIHCEMASIGIEGLQYFRDMILPLASSIGANERELAFLAECMGKKIGTGIVDLYEGMVFLQERFRVKRIHVHNLGYYLCLTEHPERERAKLLFSSLAAAAKARLGEIRHISDIEQSREVPISEKGLGELKILARHLGSREILREGIYENLVCIPTKVVEHPRSTVGLGDTISSAFFF